MANQLNYLYGTVVQGGADAFVQLAIATPLAGVTDQAAQVREILVEWPRIAVANLCDYELAFTRKSLAAMPVIDEKSLMVKTARNVGLVTSGAIIVTDKVQRLQFEEEELLIVEPTVYCQLDTNGTTGANTVRVRIGYELVKIKEVDRLNIIANSLQS